MLASKLPGWNQASEGTCQERDVTGAIFDGFKFGDANVQFDDTLLLIEPEAARRYEANLSVSPKPSSVIVEGGTPQQTAVLGQSTLFQPSVGGLDAVAKTGSGKPKSFYGSVEVSPATAKMRLVQLAEEIVSNLVASRAQDNGRDQCQFSKWSL
jgi:hypothetical protein